MARASKFPLRISTARAQTRRPERSTFRGAATLLVAILMLIALSVREFQGLLIERLEGRLDRSTTPPACGPPRDEADDIGLIASYYVSPRRGDGIAYGRMDVVRRPAFEAASADELTRPWSILRGPQWTLEGLSRGTLKGPSTGTLKGPSRDPRGTNPRCIPQTSSPGPTRDATHLR